MIIKESREPNVVRDVFTRVFGRFGIKRKKILSIRVLFLLGVAMAVLAGLYLSGFLDRYRTVRVKTNYIRGLMTQPDRLSIDIAHMSHQKLEYQRYLGLNLYTAYRVHPQNMGYVPATVRFADRVMKADIKVKGGYDHYRHEGKYSLKIKLKDQARYRGMRIFSIQTPRSRGYLIDWVLHRLLRYHGLIGLRFEFVEVVINGRNMGLYALEEYMGKELIENNQRREGPIVHFRNDMLWEARHLSLGTVYEDLYQTSDFEPYNRQKILADPVLRDQFFVAQRLLEGFRRGKLTVGQVFDINQMARIFALIDLFGSHHALYLSNMKFYYNPITAKLEPIGFDQSVLKRIHPRRLIVGGFRKIRSDASGPLIVKHREYKAKGTLFWDALFADKEFLKAYITCLDRMSQKEMLDGFFNSIRGEYDTVLRVLHRDKPDYGFKSKKKTLYENQEEIRQLLDFQQNVIAYRNDVHTDFRTVQVSLANVGPLPIVIEGLSLGKKSISPVNETMVQAYDPDRPLAYETIDFILPGKTEKPETDLNVRYRILGTEPVKRVSVRPWKRVDRVFFHDDIIRQAPNTATWNFIETDENRKVCVIQRGRWVLDRNLVVPKGYGLLCREGTQLDLRNNAIILSYAPILFAGTADAPIRILSSDSSGQGIVVLNAGERSFVQHVIFENLANPQGAGWALTGAVTFYQSPVKVTHCVFKNNRRGDDWLNIVGSDFDIANSRFERSYADAVDIDFGKGNIIECAFLASGNDAVDVSGSVVHLNRIDIEGAGDKGLSIGESSRAVGRNVEIERAQLAVAAKDLSRVEIERVTIQNSHTAFGVFQKKPEFGSADMTVLNSTVKGVEILYRLEKGSSLSINRKSMQPNPAAVTPADPGGRHAG